MTTILFLGAALRDRPGTDIGRERRNIQDELGKTRPYGPTTDLPIEPAVRPRDLQQLVLRDPGPEIVHLAFSIDGSDALFLEDGKGNPLAVKVDAWRGLFQIARRDGRCVCVVLSACFAPTLGNEIARHVECVVGTTAQLGVDPTLAFMVGFYRALGAGKSVQTAFEWGCNEIDIEGFAHEDKPRIIVKTGVLPEEVRPLVPQPAPPPPTPPIAPEPLASAVLPPPPQFLGEFVGRADELVALRDLWARPASEKGRLVFVTNLGGQGKTALVMRFLEQEQQAFPGGILWADLGTNRDSRVAGERSADISLDEVVRSVLERWEVELGGVRKAGRPLRLVRSSVRQLLSAHVAARGRCLMVLDHIDDHDTFTLFIEEFSKFDVLVTTHLRLAEAYGAPEVYLHGLEREVSRAYLAKTLGSGDQRVAGMEPVLDLVKDHALGVNLLAQTMKAHPSLSAEDALGKMKSDKHVAEEERALYGCFRLAVENLPPGLFRPFLIATASQSAHSFPLVAADYTSGICDMAKTRTIAAELQARGLIELLPDVRFPDGRVRLHRLLRDYLRHAHSREGFGFLRPGWEVPWISRILVKIGPGISAGSVNYDARQERWFLRYARQHRTDRLAVRQEWPGITAAIYRRINEGALEGARRRVSSLRHLLQGADLSGLKLNRLMLDGACLDGACLENADLSGVPLQRAPMLREVGGELRLMVKRVAVHAPVTFVFIEGYLVWLRYLSAEGSAFDFVSNLKTVAKVIALPYTAIALSLVLAKFSTRILLGGGKWLDRRSALAREFVEQVIVLITFAIFAAFPLWVSIAPKSIALLPGFFAVLLVTVGLPVALAGRGAVSIRRIFDRIGVGGLASRTAQAALSALGVVPFLVLLLSKVEGVESRDLVVGWLIAMAFPFALLGFGESPERGSPFFSVRTTYLREASLRATNLRRASFRWVRFQGADLEGADLTGADLEHADLSGAMLGGANLTDARLAHADLRDADLRGARLIGADLQGALNLKSALLSGAIYGRTTRWPEDFKPPGRDSRTDIDA